ncbi:MAG: HEAT repeat domain-containing protein [Opitutaceae bacterium]
MQRTLLVVAVLVLTAAGKASEPSRPAPEQEQVVAMLRHGAASLQKAAEILAAPGASPRMKEVSAYILGEHGKPGDDRPLLGAIADPSHQVRLATIIALQKLINPKNGRVPLRVRDTEVLLPAESAAEIDRRWPAALCARLHDQSHLVRAGAAQTLGLIGSSDCLSELRNLIQHDPTGPVRYAAAKAVELLTGKRENYVDIGRLDRQPPPLVTITKSNGGNSAELGPFFRSAWFNAQAKFTMAEGGPAHHQTIARVWWTATGLQFEIDCDDPGANDDKDDTLTLYLQPQGMPDVYSFACRRGENRLTSQIYQQEAWTKKSGDALSSSTERTNRGYKASFQIPFRALGRDSVPLDEVWGANLVRVESHRKGREISGWTPFNRDAPPVPRLGCFRFAEQGASIALQPAPADLCVFPFDDYSPAGDRNRPVDPAKETRWGRIAPPEHFRRGANPLTFSLSSSARHGDSLDLEVTVFHSQTPIVSRRVQLEPSAKDKNQVLTLELPDDASMRSVDLEIVVVARATGREIFRTGFTDIPVVAPPAVVKPYPLEIAEMKDGTWSTTGSSKVRWKIRDLGPMLTSESYPMCLVEGKDGRLYGGTYPGGRFYSYDPAAGTVEDLGSPSPPHNHLHDLVTAPDGRIYGGLYRPQGRLFSFDPRNRTTTDLGVPVAGGFSATCKVTAWAREKVYGCQGGHLFYYDAVKRAIVDKGNFLLQGRRYSPTTIVSDTDGNLLGTASGRFFRYLPETDHVWIADFGLQPPGKDGNDGGWLLNGPDGKLYVLYPDGRLFRWVPEKNQLLTVAHYAPVEPGNGVSVLITPAHELIVGRSGILSADLNFLLIYEPGQKPPLKIENPIPEHLYLTALTLARDGAVYGVSTHRAYSLHRTPIHIYSITRTTGADAAERQAG